MKPTHYAVSNQEFTRNPLFVKACEIAQVPATRRQASKWRNRRGRAYTHRNAALAALKESPNE